LNPRSNYFFVSKLSYSLFGKKTIIKEEGKLKEGRDGKTIENIKKISI